MIYRLASSLVIVTVTLFSLTQAAAAESILEDRNGDGQIEVIAFGDSITYGVGDGIEPGQYISEIGDIGKPRGYPLRLSSLLSTPILNAGVPGEMVVGIPGPKEPGVDRFPGVVVGSSSDVVVIFEGANDARYETSTPTLTASLQKMVNVARADGKAVVVATLLPPTVQHGMFAAQTALYSASIRNLATLNSIPLVDLEAGFLLACPDLSVCSYYNLPEGLHPNTVGYDAIATMFAETLQQ